jgi:DNA-directed RNA polymerase specialized sigma24 family protein
MNGASDEELLAAIAAGPGAFPEFYRRHVARVTGMGVRRFDSPEDVADFVANVFLEVLGSADRFDPRRGTAVAWLYGVAGNVAAGMYRRQARTAKAERQLAGRAFLDGDDMPASRNASTRRTGSAAPTEHFSICGSRTGACSN